MVGLNPSRTFNIQPASVSHVHVPAVVGLFYSSILICLIQDSATVVAKYELWRHFISPLRVRECLDGTQMERATLSIETSPMVQCPYDSIYRHTVSICFNSWNSPCPSHSFGRIARSLFCAFHFGSKQGWTTSNSRSHPALSFFSPLQVHHIIFRIVHTTKKLKTNFVS